MELPTNVVLMWMLGITIHSCSSRLDKRRYLVNFLYWKEYVYSSEVQKHWKGKFLFLMKLWFLLFLVLLILHPKFSSSLHTASSLYSISVFFFRLKFIVCFKVAYLFQDNYFGKLWKQVIQNSPQVNHCNSCSKWRSIYQIHDIAVFCWFLL